MKDAILVRNGPALWVLLLGLVISVGLEWSFVTGSGHSPALSLLGFQALLGLAAGLGLGGIGWALAGLLARREGYYGD